MRGDKGVIAGFPSFLLKENDKEIQGFNAFSRISQGFLAFLKEVYYPFKKAFKGNF